MRLSKMKIQQQPRCNQMNQICIARAQVSSLRMIPLARASHSKVSVLALGLFLLFSLASSTPAHAAIDSLSNVRLLLTDGHVVELDANGELAEGEPLRIDLGTASSIHAVALDAVSGRLYVTPESDYSQRGTRVFRLSALERLETLPGVTRVAIPKQVSASIITAFRYVSTSEAPPFSGLQELHENSGSSIELRSRSSPSRLLVSSDRDGIDWAKYECFISPEVGFHYFLIRSVVSLSLNIEDSPLVPAEMPSDLMVFGCWSDGTIWAVAWPELRTSESLIGRLVFLDAHTGVRAVINPPKRLSFGRIESIELGETSRWLAIIGKQTPVPDSEIGSLFDSETGVATPISLSGFAPFGKGHYDLEPAGGPFDRSYVYLVPYRYRSGGLLRKRLDRVFRLGMDTRQPLRELRLPAGLTRINQANSLQFDPSLDPAERDRRLALLAPAAPQLHAIREVEIVQILPPRSPSAQIDISVLQDD